MVKIVRIFVASPGDVAAERAHVREAVRSLNRFMAAERGVLFVVKGWEEDVLERLHEMGGQGVIDEDLPIETFDIVIGVLWQRFGTKDPKLGGETGTEHELRGAIAAWGKSKRPNVAMCFNDAPFKAKGAEAYEKAAQVERFRDEYGKLGLYITYEGADQFRDKIREWLEKYLIAKHPMAEGKKSTTIPGDPSRYISALQDQTSKIEVQGLRFGDNKAYQFPIEDFYIPLTTSAASREQTAPEGRHVQLQEALLAHRKLMVVGDPGSGKTTFLRRVVHQLCKERRDDALPIWIGAAALAEFKPANPPPEPWSPEWIPLYAGSHCEQYNRGLTADYFKAKLRAGECHVLIDGLDETPDEASRERIARLIRESADSFDKCRFAVTSRPEGKVAIRGFEEALIDDLEPEAIRAFLAKLAGFLYSSDEVKERQFRDDLKQAVKSGEIRKMARNPVMLTALAVLQHNNIKLPERRVDLYGSILEWLSKQRAKPDRLPANECLLRFRTLALAMQDHPEGRKKQAPLEWASRTLGKDLGGREKAARFLKKEQSDSGIVVSRGSEIAFWHLTFQEFLAALEISWLEDADQHELLLGGPEPRIYRPEWRETALLYAGLFAEGPRKLDALLRKLLDRMGPALPDRAKCVGLIGALKRDLIGYEVSDPRYQESLSAVMDIFDKKKSQSVPFQDRLAAAEALGQAGDSRVEEIEWVKIPASSNYRIGATKKEDPEAWEDREKPRMVPEIAPFTISKYPVTVSQYAKFVDAEPSQQPARWDEQLEHPNWPVVNVTWHQANAFCEWAKCRLPTEEEWERAARGPDRTKYPWGSNDIDPSRANYDESKIGHPTPVGLYPTGASVEGVLDLIGNVWEWTDSWYDKDQDTRVVRGGAFYNLRDYARASYRDYSLPDDLYDGLGFRVAGGIT